MDISLRRASETDIPFLLSLRDKTMRQYLEEVGCQQVLKNMKSEYALSFLMRKSLNRMASLLGCSKLHTPKN
ncbi:hypothetical protein ACOMICROBIO_LMKGKHOH_02154 [Vibrio sp. B1FIG11]|nr:hypothetical protein ACOMICROBIO_LMKGKHOH_02154 [Vibrio sp. B1FIG11]CAE6902232.1 hypothetical protein ACOMICROBIO_LMKGKHOH_02154 [Vibrio sp. B1FIG11]